MLDPELERLLPAQPDKREQLRTAWASRGKTDLFFLCKAILGMRDLSRGYHQGMCDFIASPSIRKLCLEPRGHLKSSVCLVGHTIQLIINDPSYRCLWISHSAEIVEDHLQTLQHAFLKNPLFRWLYPEVIPARPERWNRSEIMVARPTDDLRGLAQPTVRAVGFGSTKTGSHWNRIKWDDVIDDELSRDEMNRIIKGIVNGEKLLERPGEEPMDFTGTHWTNYDCYMWLKENVPGLKLRQRAALENEHGEPDLDGEPIWPERFTKEYLLSLYGKDPIQRYSFMCQYMNTPIVPEDRMFKPEWFQFYHDVPRGLRVYAGVDFATEHGRDATAIVVVGVDHVGDWYVLEAIRKFGLNPRERIDLTLQVCAKYFPAALGIERTRSEDLMFYFHEECERRHVFPNVVELNHSGRWVDRKESRIGALVPLIERGQLLLPDNGRCDALRQELEDYQGKTDDLCDALANVLEIVDPSIGHEEELLPPEPDNPMIAY